MRTRRPYVLVYAYCKHGLLRLLNFGERLSQEHICFIATYAVQDTSSAWHWHLVMLQKQTANSANTVSHKPPSSCTVRHAENNATFLRVNPLSLWYASPSGMQNSLHSKSKGNNYLQMPAPWPRKAAQIIPHTMDAYIRVAVGGNRRRTLVWSHTSSRKETVQH